MSVCVQACKCMCAHAFLCARACVFEGKRRHGLGMAASGPGAYAQLIRGHCSFSVMTRSMTRGQCMYTAEGSAGSAGILAGSPAILTWACTHTPASLVNVTFPSSMHAPLAMPARHHPCCPAVTHLTYRVCLPLPPHPFRPDCEDHWSSVVLELRDA